MGMHFQDLRELAHVIVQFIFERSWQSDTFRAMNIVYFGFKKAFSSQMQREFQSPAPGKWLSHATLLSIDEAISGVLCPLLGSPIQGTRGHTDMSPVKGHGED